MNYNRIMHIVEITHDATVDNIAGEEPEFDTFPFFLSYNGQNEAIRAIIDEEVSLLCSHTGSGKSAVFLTAAHELNLPTLVIEPRKFLQKQISEYYDDYVICGKGEYPCLFAPSAASAPCAVTFMRDKEKWFKDNDGIERPYPCSGCEYLYARRKAKRVLQSNGVLIVNFGNFWHYLHQAKFIIVDEADEFFRAISNAVKLEWVGINDLDINFNLRAEMNNVAREIEIIKSKQMVDMEDAKKLNALNAKLEKLAFFESNADLCFVYSKKKDVYVEIQPQKTPILMYRLFRGKKVCIVTATPSIFTENKK